MSHPHAAAVSIATARALEREGRLAAFFTGVAAPGEGWRAALVRLAARRRPEAGNRLVNGIPGRKLRSLALVEMRSRALARLRGSGDRARATYDSLFVAHDAAVAGARWPAEASAAYAYEDGALRTFERARAGGLGCVWDLPALHHATIERLWTAEHARWPGAMGTRPPVEPPWKSERKDRELELADVVSVASRFTRESLESAGVQKPIVVAPYGFPVDRFRPRAAAPDGELTVLSVGTHDFRKGTPYLFEAWRRAGLGGARLRVIGPVRLAPSFLAEHAPPFERVPHVPRAHLGEEYRRADLLVFPTLGDGFGLVIQEAMCSGTPVLTTPCGGGPECIDDGVEGWIVPPRDVDALVERLRFAAANRDRLAEMGRAARRRAERYDERAAGAVLVAALERALAGLPPP